LYDEFDGFEVKHIIFIKYKQKYAKNQERITKGAKGLSA